MSLGRRDVACQPRLPELARDAVAVVTLGRRDVACQPRFPELARDAVAIVTLALVAVVFFWPVLFAGHWLPRGGGDLVSFLFPMYRFIARELHAGHLPLWNPHQYAGAPLVGDNQAGLFYPPNLALFALCPNFSYQALEALVMVHVWWTGAAMYLLLRGWLFSPRLGRTACLVGAVAFMLNDVFITHLGNLNLNAALSWLPLALLGLHRASAGHGGRSCGWLLGSAVALAASLLAGHAQASFLVVVCLALYALQQVAVERTRRPLVGLAVALGLGCGLAAIGLLPAVALLPLTVRAGLAPAQMARYSLPWPGLIGLWAPGFFGRGSQAFWGWWERVEVGYLGILPWLLAVLAIARRPRRQVLFPGVLTLLGVILALGPRTPFYQALLAPWGLPFRAPARFLLLFNLGMAMLAAMGVDWLAVSSRARARQVLAGAGAGATGLWLSLALVAWHLGRLYPARQGEMLAALVACGVIAALGLGVLWLQQGGRLGRRAALALVLGLLVADLVALGSRVEVDSQTPTAGFERTVALDFLRRRAGLDRLETATWLWQPGAAQLYGLYALDGVYNPMSLGLYAYYVDGLRYRGSAPYDLAGVRYIVAGKEEPPSDQGDIRPVFDHDPAVTIYENRGALPRVRFVTGAEVIGDEAAAYARLHDPDHDPRRSVVLLEGQSRLGRPVKARIAGLTYEPNEIRLRLQCDQPGYLVLSDVYHPGWRAWVDGQPAEVLRADFAFRALEVPAGEHSIRLWYEPPLWRLGIAMSLASLATLALGLVGVASGRAGRREGAWFKP